MLDSDSSQILFQAVEKDAVLVARRIEELKTKAAVRFLRFCIDKDILSENCRVMICFKSIFAGQWLLSWP